MHDQISLFRTWASPEGVAEEALAKLGRAKQEITEGYGTEAWDDDPDETIVIGREVPAETGT